MQELYIATDKLKRPKLKANLQMALSDINLLPQYLKITKASQDSEFIYLYRCSVPKNTKVLTPTELQHGYNEPIEENKIYGITDPTGVKLIYAGKYKILHAECDIPREFGNGVVRIS